MRPREALFPDHLGRELRCWSSGCQRRTFERAPLAQHFVLSQSPCRWDPHAGRADRDSPVVHSRFRQLANLAEFRFDQTASLIQGQAQAPVAPGVLALPADNPGSMDQIRSSITYRIFLEDYCLILIAM